MPPTQGSAPSSASVADGVASTVNGLLDQVRQLQSDLGSCRVQTGQLQESGQRCQEQVARCRQAAASRLATGTPEGRLTHVGCFHERDAGNNPVMRLVGAVEGTGSVVAECARLATDRAVRGQTVVFGVARGNQCWAANDLRQASGGGQAPPQQCGLAPDERGQVVGGNYALSVYTLAPRGVDARYLRVVRQAGGAADLHVVGAAVVNAAGETVAFRAATTRPTAPTPLADPVPGEEAVGTAQELVERARGGLGASRGVLRLGPELGSAVTFDLGETVHVAGVHLRNRSVPGRPEIEDRLRGCAVQLLTQPDGAAPVWEQTVTFGAPSYHWEVR